jgi:hypothetical protein
MKHLSIKIFFILLAITVFLSFQSQYARAQEESTTTPTEEATTTFSFPPEVQAAIDKQANYKVETENFDVRFSPPYPGPNTKVFAEVISYTFDVNRATIAWILNGKITGTGKTFSFTTGGPGTKTILQVSIVTPSKNALSQSFTFQGAEVDLVWETPGYAPPQYQGKILAVAQSSIKMTAIPWGVDASDSKLIYEWKKNGKNLPNDSGQGKKTLIFYASEAGEDAVSIAVSTADKSKVAENQIILKIGAPKILFYEESPLEGPQYQKELGENLTLAKPEFILRAEPYFFSKRALPALPYEWQMNDKKVEGYQKPNVLYLTVPEETSQGSSLIKLSLSNALNVLETAGKTLQINFNLSQ